MNKKIDVFKIIGFVIIFSLVFFYTSGVFLPKSRGKFSYLSKTETFYDQPENSIDLLFFSDSTFRHGISPLTMWQESGITGYVRATSRQDPMIAYSYLLESLKTQQPKLVVLDSSSLFSNYDIDVREPTYREAVDYMRFSMAKIQLVMEILSESETQTLSSYIFPLLRYHSRWKEIELEDLKYIKNDGYDHFRGHTLLLENIAQEIPQDYMLPTDTMAGYNERALAYHQKTIQLCQEKGIEVVYLELPGFDRSTYAQHLGAKQMAEKYGLLFIDFSMPEIFDVVGFDPSTDMSDANHLNTFGAQKFSRHLAAILDEEFNLPDKRNVPGYEQWDVDLQYFLSLLSGAN